jgi:hypothetical protein
LIEGFATGDSPQSIKREQVERYLHANKETLERRLGAEGLAEYKRSINDALLGKGNDLAKTRLAAVKQNIYNASAGEAESRNTQSRLGTDRTAFPDDTNDVAREDRIVRFDETTMASLNSFRPPWLQQRNPQPGGAGNPVNDALYERLTESHNTLWDKLKRSFNKNFAPGGLLPQQVFDRKIARDGSINAEEMQVTYNVGVLDHEIKRVYGKAYEQLAEADQKALDAALRGTPVQLDAELMRAIEAMRQHVDALSGRYGQILWSKIQDLQSNGQDAAAAGKLDLFNTIMSHQGE